MSDVICESIAGAPVYEQLLDTSLSIVEESRIHFNEDGIAMRAVDPVNVAMVYTELDTAAFESYQSPGAATVGANLHALSDRLDAANADDIVQWAVDMETRMLEVSIRHIDQSVALIDPDVIRQEPDEPDLDLPNRVTVEGATLAEAVDVADLVSDHIELHGDVDGECVRVVAQGDTDETIVEWGHEQVIDAKVTEDTESVFSLDYLTNLAGPIPDAAEVEIVFGHEFPMRLEWAASDGYQQTTYMLAPRIQNR